MVPIKNKQVVLGKGGRRERTIAESNRHKEEKG
jgi:hypothetical protein